MIDNDYFKIQDAIDQYGVKNLRIMIPATPVDFSFFIMTGVPIALHSSEDKQVWAEYLIDECDYNHKTKLIPHDKYKIKISSYGEDVGETNVFSNERYYTSDLNHKVRTGYARVYLQTEDGYQLIYGVYEDVFNDEEIKVLEWIKNFFNQQRFVYKTEQPA